MEFKTPSRSSKQGKIVIPPSPCLKKIGYGTGVAVYEFQRSPVRDKLRSPWAVKKLLKKFKDNKEVSKRLRDEANVLLKLNHKNIVGFRAFIEQSGDNMLAMEECTISLGDMIEERMEKTEEPFPVTQIKKFSSDIADALKYLHNEALLLHCDIKSYNILVKDNFVVCKLCDFGVCLPIDKHGNLDKDKLDEEPEYPGTMIWCPPEIVCFPQIITSKADIYSYGLVIWEMIALMPPLNDTTVDSNSSLNSSCEIRKRPDLPCDVELGEEYEPVLELFFICTDENYDRRPSASNLCEIITNIF